MIESHRTPSQRRALLAASLGAALAAGGMARAFGQDAPYASAGKGARVIVPYPPGGPTDIAARLVCQKLTERYGQAFTVDNKPGAGGNIGAELAAHAPADGYTLLVGTTAHAINPSLFQNLPYDVLRDFAPVALLTSMPLIVVVTPSLPINSISELIAYTRRPGANVAYGSSGNGQSTHLAVELFKSMTGAQMTHVPYKGSAPALTDTSSGQVGVMFDTMLSAMPQVKAGRVKPLAVTSTHRSPAAPELPTVAEAGVAGYEATAWNGMMAPAATPAPIVAALNRDINAILAEPDMVKRLAADGTDAGQLSTQAFGAFVRNEVTKWAKVVKQSGATLG